MKKRWENSGFFLFLLLIFGLIAQAQTPRAEVPAHPQQAKPVAQATGSTPAQGEVEQLRGEVKVLRDEIERLRSLVETRAKESEQNSLNASQTRVTDTLQADQSSNTNAPQRPSGVQSSGAPQSTSAPDNSRIAIAPKSQGGDLAGAGRLLRTDRITIGGYGDFQFRESSINERADGGGTPTFQNTRFVLGIA